MCVRCDVSHVDGVVEAPRLVLVHFRDGFFPLFFHIPFSRCITFCWFDSSFLLGL